MSKITAFQRGPEVVKTKLADVCNDAEWDFVYTFVVESARQMMAINDVATSFRLSTTEML
jgi:hypothetical protein